MAAFRWTGSAALIAFPQSCAKQGHCHRLTDDYALLLTGSGALIAFPRAVPNRVTSRHHLTDDYALLLTGSGDLVAFPKAVPNKVTVTT